MKIDWKGLRQQKLEELPAAEVARQKRKKVFDKRVQRITDTVEKNIYKACKHQEAGTTVRYAITDYGSFLDSLKDRVFIVSGWCWDGEIKDVVMPSIIERLSQQGISVEGVEGWYEVDITLP